MMNPERESEDVFDLLRSLSFGKLKASFIKHTLDFKNPGKTSRGVMHNRDVWYLKVWEEAYPEFIGWGECSPLPGLSIDDLNKMDDRLLDVCLDINQWEDLLNHGLADYPSVAFGLEQAVLDLRNQGNKVLFPSKFTDGNEVIRINGLVWMAGPQNMIDQINQKIQDGFRCLKLKVGALDFREELYLLEEVRNIFGPEELELRLDANGAFSPDEAMTKMEELAEFGIHSIEQPIRAGQWEEMGELCRLSPIPIALDEELIPIIHRDEREEMLDTVLPAFIILKPSLLGGFQHSEEWIELAQQREIGWWITSALESNLGLNAIAQWTFTKQNPMYQGLGTGQVFTNNITSPLYLDGEHLMYDPQKKWKLEG